jgi:hypothetical protein
LEATGEAGMTLNAADWDGRLNVDGRLSRNSRMNQNFGVAPALPFGYQGE